MPISGFVTDTSTSIDAFINEGIELLHDKLVEAYGSDYVEKSSAFTHTINTDVSLPADFYKLLGVDLNYQGGVLTLSPYNRRERNSYRNAGTFGLAVLPGYKLSSVGGIAGTGALRLLPSPASGTTGVIWYSPTATTLVAPGDTVNFPGGWEKYVVIYAAMQCLAKEESDTSFLQGQLAMLDAKFQSIMENRDVGAPTHSVDVEGLNDNWLGWW